MNLRRFSFLATLAACSIFFAFPAHAQTELVTLTFRGRQIQVPSYLVDTYIQQGATYVAPSAPAAKHSDAVTGKIGTLFSKGRVDVNGASMTAGQARAKIAIEDCTVVKTYDKPATVQLDGGGYILINPNTAVQICKHKAGNVVATVIGGGNGRGAQVFGSSNQQDWRTVVDNWLQQTGVTDSVELPGYLASLGFSSVFPSIGGGGSGSSGTSGSGTTPTPTYPNP